MNRFFFPLFLVMAAIAWVISPAQASPQAPHLPKSPLVVVWPGDPVHALVQRHPAGTTFLFKSGVHHIQVITPKDGNTFVGEYGAILSGALPLRSFTKEGPYWTVTTNMEPGPPLGRCLSGQAGCRHPEDVFIDHQVLRQVTSLRHLRPGTWFFDYRHGRVYLADNPTGKKVEISARPHAFKGSANHVTIRGLIIEKFASPAQHGAIHAQDGPNGPYGEQWLVMDNEIRRNHGSGIRLGNGMKVIRNHIHHNGQLGIGGGEVDIVIENNEIAYNNTQGFSTSWEAGGTKFVRTRNLTVRGNYVHHNNGPGLWTDIDNVDTLYENNRVVRNRGVGIFHEISYAAIIRNNVVEGNGFGFSEWLWGAGILVAASSDVEIYGNTVSNNANGICAIQQKRGRGSFGRHVVENLHVYNNIIIMKDGLTGLAQDLGDSSLFTQKNNRFENNIYLLGKNKRYFAWWNSEQTEKAWKSFGHDLTGTLTR